MGFVDVITFSSISQDSVQVCSRFSCSCREINVKACALLIPEKFPAHWRINSVRAGDRQPSHSIIAELSGTAAFKSVAFLASVLLSCAVRCTTSATTTNLTKRRTEQTPFDFRHLATLRPDHVIPEYLHALPLLPSRRLINSPVIALVRNDVTTQMQIALTAT